MHLKWFSASSALNGRHGHDVIMAKALLQGSIRIGKAAFGSPFLFFINATHRRRASAEQSAGKNPSVVVRLQKTVEVEKKRTITAPQVSED
jgi:hypothetical protein